VLGASSPEANVFSDDDVLLARILASCSVPAIERSRLERLSAVDEMTLAFNSRTSCRGYTRRWTARGTRVDVEHPRDGVSIAWAT